MPVMSRALFQGEYPKKISVLSLTFQPAFSPSIGSGTPGFFQITLKSISLNGNLPILQFLKLHLERGCRIPSTHFFMQNTLLQAYEQHEETQDLLIQTNPSISTLLLLFPAPPKTPWYFLIQPLYCQTQTKQKNILEAESYRPPIDKISQHFFRNFMEV